MMFQTADHAAPPIYISEELAERTADLLDFTRQGEALRALADAMDNAPEEVLPRLVELAAELTGGTSVGLCLHEADPAPGGFRWRHTSGVLIPLENALTPDNGCLGGVALDRRAPTLAAHPELVHGWLADAGIAVPEVLLIPLHLDADEPLGTLWIVGPCEGHFDRNHAQLATDLARFAAAAVRMIRREQSLRAALEEQEIVAREMSHRLNNLFAVADGLIRSSARTAQSVPELVKMLSGRVHALAAAHSVVKRRVRDLDSGHEQIELADLVSAITEAHETLGGADRDRPGGGQRFTITGPSVGCGDHAANSFALVIHELTTNAAKYGALSVPSGRVSIDWQLADSRMVLRWTERGGPLVTSPPERAGFGSTLIRRTIEGQFNGGVEQDWRPEGLTVTLTAPLERLAF
jgi:two-component sensor histidine kinase